MYSLLHFKWNILLILLEFYLSLIIFEKKNNAGDEKFRDNASALFVDVFISTWHCKHIYAHIFYFVMYISPLISVGAFVSGKLYPWLIKVSYPNDGLKIAFNIAMSYSRYGNFIFLSLKPHSFMWHYSTLRIIRKAFWPAAQCPRLNVYFQDQRGKSLFWYTLMYCT